MNNDRFKFRFWDEEDKKHIYYGSLYNIKIPYTEMSTFPQYESSPRFHKGIFEQCLGQPATKSYRGDKPEDLLIWEGDEIFIPEYNDTWIVAWCGDDDYPAFDLKTLDGRGHRCDSNYIGSLIGEGIEIEIIGTIHGEKK